LSILTDTDYFGGYDEFVQQARLSGVTIPILYKNFVIDEYQLFQARFCGATAVLLIAADLTYEACGTLMHTAHQLGLEVLLEMHGERDFEYAQLEPDMYGINNRNLGTFVTMWTIVSAWQSYYPRGYVPSARVASASPRP
jgi:indole-3-glycerol phosphate synthase